MLDPIGNQIDAEAAQGVGKFGWMDVGRSRPDPIEQERRRHLDEAEAALVQIARVNAKVGKIVHRKTETSFGE